MLDDNIRDMCVCGNRCVDTLFDTGGIDDCHNGYGCIPDMFFYW